MEEILHKNLIHKRDFLKLSPDYVSDLPLRMEMRRNALKDTHGSGTSGGGVFKSGCWPRKSLKRSRDCYRFNKEIVKIRDTFSNMELKNKLMLKYVDTLKPKTLTKNDKFLIAGNKKEIEAEKDHFIDEITNDMNNMVIQCDSEFKLISKPKVEKTCPKYRKNENNKIETVERPSPEIEGLTSEVLRVECKYYNDLQNVEALEVECQLVNGDMTENEIKENGDDNLTQDNYILGNDLQSLLIMMALSPKCNKSDNERESAKSARSFNDNPNIEGTGYYEQNTDAPEFNGDFENVLNIIPIRIKISSHQEALLKKYVTKWRNYVNNKKEQFYQQRQAALDLFFDKLTKKKEEAGQSRESIKKSKLLARDYNTYQRRYKLQKHIIALQRAKLEEQNRMIEELKYKKILDASRTSVDAVREEVRKAYFDIDRQLKPKLKCITNELKLKDIEEPSLVLHCLKVPQFLKRMEKRAREREEKHAMIRERRKQMEEERLRMKQEAELAKLEMDKEEKMKRWQELTAKRKREKVEAIRKKQFAERMRALIVMADLHYEKSLMAKYLEPFKIMLAIRRYNIEKAKSHYEFQLKKHVFLNWMWYTEDMWFERNYKADAFYRKNILRKAFDALRRNKYQYVLKKQVADDYYDFYVTKLGFRKLREAIEVIKMENEMKMKRATAYHNRTLPALNALKREQDARKARWREKVLQVVPDYMPPED